jgi:hypothetical protein
MRPTLIALLLAAPACGGTDSADPPTDASATTDGSGTTTDGPAPGVACSPNFVGNPTGYVYAGTRCRIITDQIDWIRTPDDEPFVLAPDALENSTPCDVTTIAANTFETCGNDWDGDSRTGVAVVLNPIPMSGDIADARCAWVRCVQ